MVGQPAFGVDRGRTSGAGRGDGLPVGVIHQVTGGEHTVHRGVGGPPAGLDVTLVVQVDLAADQLGARVVPDGDEHAGDGQVGLFSGDRVAQPDAADLGVTLDGGDGRVGQDGDLLVGLGAFEHDP